MDGLDNGQDGGLDNDKTISVFDIDIFLNPIISSDEEKQFN